MESVTGTPAEGVMPEAVTLPHNRRPPINWWRIKVWVGMGLCTVAVDYWLVRGFFALARLLRWLLE